MSEKQPITSQPGQNHQPLGGYDQPPGSDYPPVSGATPYSQFHDDDRRLLLSLEGNREWSSALFDCSKDPLNCVCVFFCSPCVMCQLASWMGECLCMPLFVPAASITMRARLRTLGGIRGTICNDCLVMSFCGYCALCQMKREMDGMGLIS